MQASMDEDGKIYVWADTPTEAYAMCMTAAESRHDLPPWLLMSWAFPPDMEFLKRARAHATQTVERVNRLSSAEYEQMQRAHREQERTTKES